MCARFAPMKALANNNVEVSIRLKSIITHWELQFLTAKNIVSITLIISLDSL